MRLSIGLHGGSVNLCALGYRDRLEIPAIADAVNIRHDSNKQPVDITTIITSASAVSSLEVQSTFRHVLSVNFRFAADVAWLMQLKCSLAGES